MTDDRPVVGVVLAPGTSPIDKLQSLDGEADVRFVHADDVGEVLEEATVLAVYDFRTDAIQKAWGRVRHLRWMHAASAGLDSVLFPESEASDVLITNSRGVFDRPIAEFVLGMMLIFAKDVLTTLDVQSRREWRYRETERLEGQTVLVVGAGSIGRAVAGMAKCGGMNVFGIARQKRAHDPDFGHVDSPARLRERLAEADFVVISAPLTGETSGMFGPDEFSAFKRGARLINVGRGPIVQQDALIAALKAGRVGGAALDVFEEEPLPADSPLWTMPNVVVSPHQAGDFIGWREAIADLFVENFRRWRRGDEMLNVVKDGGHDDR